MTEKTLPPKKIRKYLRLSFVMFVVIPFLLGGLYYTLIASDRYVSSAGFAVRKMDAGGGSGLIGVFTGLSGAGSTTSDSYIVLNYLKSQDLVRALERDVDFDGKYAKDNVDIFSRLNPTLGIEHKVKYWQSMIKTTFNASSGVVTFDVEAFSAKDAQAIATLVLVKTRELVNVLSKKAREDSVHFANAEVEHTEKRLKKVLAGLQQFRENEHSIDPVLTAQLQTEMLGNLETHLLNINTRINTLSKSVDQDSPVIRALQNQSDALEKQIEARAAGANVHGVKPERDKALTGILSRYENLLVEKSFAEQAYASALSSLEAARVEADRQQSYLAVYSKPAIPDQALYPQRLLDIFLLLVSLLGLWGIGTLIVYSVRDHLS